MLPTKPNLLKTLMSQELLVKSVRKILEIKILGTQETGLLAPKKQDQVHLGSAVTNLPAASPIP